MSNRYQWRLGASSCVVTGVYGLSEYSFYLFKDANIPYTEISANETTLDMIDFIHYPEKVLEITQKNDVRIWSFHLPFSTEFCLTNPDNARRAEILEKLKRYVSAAVKIGIKTFVVHPSGEPIEDASREAAMQTAIEGLKELTSYCGGKGAVLAVENLPRSCLGNCSAEMIRFLKEVPNLQMCFDTNHLTNGSNEDFLQDLLDNGLQGRIRTIHVSDYDLGNEKHRLPLDGKNNWEAIIALLEELDYTGVFMYESDKPWDRPFYIPLPAIEENFHVLIK